PLCQIGLGRDGTVWLVAAGRANHAGTAKATRPMPPGDGNSLYIGIDAFNDGRGEAWPQAQDDAYAPPWAAPSREVTKGDASTVRGHKESSVTGKVDPTFDMNLFRDVVAERLNTRKDWLAMATQKELEAVVRAVVRDELSRALSVKQVNG